MPREAYVLSGYLQATAAFLTAFVCSLEDESCSSKQKPYEEDFPDLSDGSILSSNASASRSILYDDSHLTPEELEVAYREIMAKMCAPKSMYSYSDVKFKGQLLKDAKILDVRDG